MTLMMKTCFFSLAILFLWQVQDGAEACSCINIPPEQVFCKAHMVFRATVTGRHVVDDPLGKLMTNVKYDVEVSKVYKGPAIFFDAVYTSSSSAACGVTLDPRRQEYVLTGHLGDDGAVHVSLCDFYVQRFALTHAQRRALNQCTQSACVC